MTTPCLKRVKAISFVLLTLFVRRHSASRVSVRWDLIEWVNWIFFVTFNCLFRGAERHELSRRNRHTSGMALPAISDSFDAFDLLGLDRNEHGQVRGCYLDFHNYNAKLIPCMLLSLLMPNVNWQNRSPFHWAQTVGQQCPLWSAKNLVTIMEAL